MARVNEFAQGNDVRRCDFSSSDTIPSVHQ